MFHPCFLMFQAGIIYILLVRFFGFTTLAELEKLTELTVACWDITINLLQSMMFFQNGKKVTGIASDISTYPSGNQFGSFA